MDCSDEVAMVELSHVLRVYYVCCPLLYQNISDLYDWIHLQPNSIDYFVFNFGSSIEMLPHSIQKQLQPAFNFSNSTRIWNWGDLHDIHAAQSRDLNGRWFRAINPGIENPPDYSNGWFPGFPDDEVNLLLFLLLWNAGLQASWTKFMLSTILTKQVFVDIPLRAQSFVSFWWTNMAVAVLSKDQAAIMPAILTKLH
jgi:hypothetical protein